MPSSFDKLKQLLATLDINEKERKSLDKLLRKVGREFEKAEFKYSHTSREKEALRVLLDETVQELERKNKTLTDSNTQLATAEEELRQKKETLEVTADQLQKINATLEERITDRTAALEQKRKRLEVSNHRIRSSINYAQRIQQAILPTPEKFAHAFEDSFLFFKPRDIVSGDFYFIHRLQTEGKTWQVVLVADCTGHGVPGAFVSLVGLNLLHETVALKKKVDPSEILKELHLGIRRILKQEETSNRDGMDVAICSIELESRTVQFAGARNPLVYMQGDEMVQLKGTRASVGEPFADKNPFQKQSFQIPKNASINCYLFSDGFQDQFGGDEGRKFMAKNFRALLSSISCHPMDRQKQLLEEKLNTWQFPEGTTGYQQVDDILVVGFRL